MLVLAVDTATPAVTAGVVELTDRGWAERGSRVTVDARAHGELLTPHLLAALREAGRQLSEVGAIVCGVGPGPFTGLRAGMATAAALGHALNVPVYPVCTLDAIASSALAGQQAGGRLLVATDARRKEVYWAVYEADGRRVSGPAVDKPADVLAGMPGLGVTRLAGGGVRHYPELAVVPVADCDQPTVHGLISAAHDQLRAGGEPEPLVPLYLRRPDAALPGARKRVTPV